MAWGYKARSRTESWRPTGVLAQVILPRGDRCGSCHAQVPVQAPDEGPFHFATFDRRNPPRVANQPTSGDVKACSSRNRFIVPFHCPALVSFLPGLCRATPLIPRRLAVVADGTGDVRSPSRPRTGGISSSRNLTNVSPRTFPYPSARRRHFLACSAAP